MLVIITCGKVKRSGRHKAGDLYIGAYFRAAYKWATSVAPRGAIYVLSAKYGLVHIDDPIDSYDLTLGQPGSISPGEVRRQAIARSLEHQSDVVVLAGQRYVQLARQVWPDARAPFGKGGGILERATTCRQIGAFTRWHGRVPSPVENKE